ncbi:RES family NAD+ phosphorylase [Neorhizobium sp. DT-125]|uniref:RES family NAD+ phosphorylase n=1 Tax=Neorhizobium sp. DT-125 TaxID=3396163 RepID=UPI003F1B5CEE
MTVPHRGPSGAAPPPSDWLVSASLPIDEVPAGHSLQRVHRSAVDPVFFGPGPGNPPTNRFDSADGHFGVLYVGMSRRAALAETILRNPRRLMVAMNDITSRSVSELTCERPLRLVRMYGSGLQALGTDNAVPTGPYAPCGLWGDTLFAHRDRPDGIAYQSRHDSGEICLALFERDDMAIAVRAATRLSAILGEVAAMLDGYGKSLSPGASGEPIDKGGVV